MAPRWVGSAPDVARLFVATAHHRNGILMAPITAALMTRGLADGEIPDSLTPFRPGRFLP